MRFLKKPPPQAETCKGNRCRQKRNFFYFYAVKAQAVKRYADFGTENQQCDCKFAFLMYNSPDILTLAYKQIPLQEQMVLLYEKKQRIPGSVQYSIKRYRHHLQTAIEDTGMMVYHYIKDDPEKNYLELKFCLSGNVYCKQKDTECNMCKAGLSKSCVDKVNSADVLSFKFAPAHLSQFVRPRRTAHTISEDILTFLHPFSFTRILPLCGKTRMVLEALLNHNYTDSLENIYSNAQIQMLLLYSMDCMIGEKDIDVINCKFLSNEADREKIIKAREVLIRHIGEPITIKELSRKVAINECYLKKGFKEMFGTTIFDFYQGQRMEHARYLLYEKGLSVTDVSLLLGYSSISHFSTAFKKHTGLKPCELLLR
jgi:AraC-like DNA-binding protein